MRENPTIASDTSPRFPQSDAVLSRRRLLQLALAGTLLPSFSSCAQKEAVMGIVSTAPDAQRTTNMSDLEGEESIIGRTFHVRIAEEGQPAWEGAVEFTSPTTVRVNGKEFSCLRITTVEDGVSINVEEASSMLTNPNVRSNAGVTLSATLGSITIDESAFARAARTLDGAEEHDGDVSVSGVPCTVSHMFSMHPMERTVRADFSRVDARNP